jgi:hypothetical protein
VVALDHAELTACIARQARVGQVDIAGAHALARLECGSDRNIASLSAVCKPRRDFAGGGSGTTFCVPFAGRPLSISARVATSNRVFEGRSAASTFLRAVTAARRVTAVSDA